MDEFGHDYDIKLSLYWEANSSADIDFYAYFENESDGVSYQNKHYYVDDENQMWLDQDYTWQGDEVYPEIISWLGLTDKILTVGVENYNRGDTLQNDVYIEITTKAGELLDTIVVPKELMHSTHREIIEIFKVKLSDNSITMLDTHLAN